MFLPPLDGFDGKWLARFRARLDHQPSRGPDEIGIWRKIGRLALAFVVVSVLMAPLVWLALWHQPTVHFSLA